MNRRKPNLFVIGAMKAETSSFHQLLGRHPRVFMSDFKEPQYFAVHKRPFHGWWGEGKELPSPGPAWYLDLFRDAGNADWVGESSTTYTKRPHVEGCARRIRNFNPDARLIYVVRDPVRRAISHYWHFLLDKSECRPPLRAFRADPNYVAYSNYAMQLGPFVSEFGLDQIFVLTLEHLIHKPRETMDALCHWLGVEPYADDPVLPRENTGASSIWRVRPMWHPLAKFRHHWRVQRAIGRTPICVRDAVRRLTCELVDRNDTDISNSVAHLRRELIVPTKRFCEMLGRSFPEWTTLFGDKENE